VIGILTALRHRDVTGTGQHVDIAMLDAMVSMADIVPNLWSLGQRPTDDPSGVMGSFRAADGWFVMQVVREHQFTALANLIGMPGWLTDERLSSRAGWGRHLESVIRPAVESWAAGRTRVEVCDAIGRAGIPAGPVYTAPEVIADPHVEARHMIVEMPRSDDVDTPVLIPGNPVKMSRLQEGPETRGAVGRRAHRRGAPRTARPRRTRAVRAPRGGCDTRLSPIGPRRPNPRRSLLPFVRSAAQPCPKLVRNWMPVERSV
jgi:crotonobetainyl-CoA:carnitine CoA-transferase CaiB-like acyl-CoA transferase